MQTALLLSLTFGFFAASPVGPVGLMCLRRILLHGLGAGLASALGIALADAIWSFIAVHGLANAAHWIETQQTLLQTGIGLFFLFYGLHAVFNTPSTRYHRIPGTGRTAEFLSTFLVVFLNPATFITFSALFALFGVARSYFGLLESLEVAVAVFTGATLFWLALAQVLARAGPASRDTVYDTLAHKSAYAILLFGVGILAYRLYALR